MRQTAGSQPDDEMSRDRDYRTPGLAPQPRPRCRETEKRYLDGETAPSSKHPASLGDRVR
ncbi:hypothetical protein AcV5_009528 [Taiwanofungus camphoratus]|nr:hypothetical protein AcV5_009528 [Antrodia cinnamomea]